LPKYVRIGIMWIKSYSH